MITVKNALNIILKEKKDFGTEIVSLEKAIGRVLRENLKADRDFPPYNRVTMDGIAIQYEAFATGQRAFDIEEISPAGAPQATLKKANHCIEIMTGAVLPKNTDTIIRYEDVVIMDKKATIQIDSIVKSQNIHPKGKDRKKGEIVVPEGVLISSAEVGIAATIGKATVKVARFPKTIIISTGDELVEIDEKPLAHQIRKSNVHRIKATLLQYGIKADTNHLKDDLETINLALKSILSGYEVIILSGGVSEGKFDFLPTALSNLGVQQLFHGVQQRPGKPFWFGKAKNGTLVFALPGNPVSSFLCTHRYFLTWLKSNLNLPEKVLPHGVLTQDVEFKPDLVYFLQVQVNYNEKGEILATPVAGNGSGDLANLTDADAFLELPLGKKLFKKGEAYPLLFFR